MKKKHKRDYIITVIIASVSLILALLSVFKFQTYDFSFDEDIFNALPSFTEKE